MKKVYIKAYLAYNFGDDLFVHIFCNRYKNIECKMITKYEYPAGIFGKNTKLITKKDIKFVNKVIRVLSLKNNSYENILMKNSDFSLIIGGSMFMESNTAPSKYLVGGGKDYYIIGSNFGPYQTQQYYNKFYNVFKNASDVCFREKYSYDLFSDLPNVRVAPDIVFSLDVSNVKIIESIKVVISVIDCTKKVDAKYKDLYEKKIIELINFFDKRNYGITLMSFCKAEGDELAIESIISKISNNELKDRINSYYYNGNIEEALNIMGDCQVIVGSRFHANILGLILNKTILPIAYSDKTINVLRDCSFDGKIFDVRSLDKFDINCLNDDDLNYKLDISEQIKASSDHFEKLDLVLERK